MNLFLEQYSLIRNSREALFTYCDALPWNDVITPLELFAGGSIRNLLVHEANVYRHWLSRIALQRELPYFEKDGVKNMDDLRHLFGKTDTLVHEFIDHFKDQWLEALPWTIPGRSIMIEAAPLKIFTHVITHEFHHKGQILFMSRQLGHIPPDTDVIRF